MQISPRFDRVVLKLIIVILAGLFVFRIIGDGMIDHWNNDDRFSKPDPAYLRLRAADLAKDRH